MNTTESPLLRRLLAVVAATVLLGGCADEALLAPEGLRGTTPGAANGDLNGRPPVGLGVQFARGAQAEEAVVIATLRRVTARYHNLDAAIEDGFVLLSPCEVLPGHGPAGLLYAHFGRVLDGVINLEEPEGLLYEPSSTGPPKLVAVDLAVLYTDSPDAPEFLGHTFQPEDEFGAWALHVWIWRHNPEGMFAPANPNVTC
jgi:hypothetical protein